MRSHTEHGNPMRDMKYAIIIPDGCADEPQESLGGQHAAGKQRTRRRWMRLSRLGVVGRSNNVPAHLPAGSDVANLSLFGYDPIEYFTGRAPLEAAAQGIELGPDDWAIRCNLVTIENQMMRSFTADHISTDEATELLKTCQEQLGTRLSGVRSRRELSQSADLSRGEAGAAVHARHAGHAAARFDRQIGGGRFSSRSGQRLAQ